MHLIGQNSVGTNRRNVLGRKDVHWIGQMVMGPTGAMQDGESKYFDYYRGAWKKREAKMKEKGNSFAWREGHWVRKKQCMRENANAFYWTEGHGDQQKQCTREKVNVFEFDRGVKGQ